MQPLVQSAIDAANRGENNKALELCKQALAANPNDVDAWLVVAAVVEQPERKRQCLNRVLSLDPTNQIARDELLDMDRAAMGGTSSLAPEPVADTRQSAPVSRPTYPSAPPPPDSLTSTSAFESEPVSQTAYPSSFSSEYPPSTSAFESTPAFEQLAPIAPQIQTNVAPKPSSKTRAEKPLVFRYPLFWRIIMYGSVVFFGCVGLLVASQDVVNSLFIFGLALLMGLVAMTVSPKVEITEAGIRASGVFSSSEAKWNEIKSLKSSGMKQRLELVKSNGQVVKVSSQVSGYPRVVEILRQKRPDLFSLAASTVGPVLSGRQGGSVAAPAFSGTKVFKKSFFAQYGVILLMIPLCMVSAWMIVLRKDYFGGIGVGVVALIFMSLSLFAVTMVKVQANTLSTESLFGGKKFTAQQIKNITMKTVRSRHGIATNLVHIEPVEGSAFDLGGFPEGEEVLYGFLTNWWNAYRNR